MSVLALTSDGKKIAIVTASGPSSYTSGGFSVRVSALNKIDAVLDVRITGGYKVGGYSISGNSVTIVVHHYNYPATSAGASVEVSAGTDLSAQTVTLVVLGS